MKCPNCESRIDHKNYVTGARGEDYYICPACERRLAAKYGFVQVMLFAIVGLPVVTLIVDVLLAFFINPVFGDVVVFGIELRIATSFVTSCILVIGIVKYVNRLVEVEVH